MPFDGLQPKAILQLRPASSINSPTSKIIQTRVVGKTEPVIARTVNSKECSLLSRLKVLRIVVSASFQ